VSLLQLPGPEGIKVLVVSHLPPSWIFAGSASARLVTEDFVWRIVFLRTSKQRNFFDVHFYWGTRWGSWLRHCVTSRKFAGSISDDVIEIFHWHNPSGDTMALGLTHPLKGMSIRAISWSKGGRFVGLKTLSHSCADCLQIWEPQPPGTLRNFPGM